MLKKNLKTAFEAGRAVSARGVKRLVPLMLMVAPVAVATSCEKDTPIDPIKQLTETRNNARAAYHASVNRARLEPEDVSKVFDGRFDLHVGGEPVTNTADSIKVTDHLADAFSQEDPHHPNIPNVKLMKPAGATYTLAEQKLQEALAKVRQ